jgi:hypothetical protein
MAAATRLLATCLRCGRRSARGVDRPSERDVQVLTREEMGRELAAIEAAEKSS